MKSLFTTRLELTPYRLADRDTFCNWVVDRAVERFLAKSFSDSLKSQTLFEAFVAASNTEERARFIWTARLRASETPIGHFELKRTSKCGLGELEIVYFIEQRCRRQGFATEAVEMIAAQALQTEECSEVVAFINPANRASRSVVEKASFVMATQPNGERALEKWRRGRPHQVPVVRHCATL